MQSGWLGYSHSPYSKKYKNILPFHDHPFYVGIIKNTQFGKGRVQLDGVGINTFDGYNAG
jgi:hypothetical protein